MESPVWTPMGSMFSMEQTITTLSLASRITSSSNSFQPPSNTTSMPSQREARPHNHRKPQPIIQSSARLLQVPHHFRLRDTHADRSHGRAKLISGFRPLDGVIVSPYQLHTEALQG